MVRDEETEYRMEPSWTPDGQNILYVTEDEGSNDIRIVPAAGGDAIELTIDADAPRDVAGGEPGRHARRVRAVRCAACRRCTPRHHRRTAERMAQGARSRHGAASTPTGRVRIRVSAPDGQPMAARIYVDASDGRHYTPDDAFHRSMMVFDRHYFHMTAEAEVEVPAGRTTHRGASAAGSSRRRR